MTTRHAHLVLLGDSIFDNQRYVAAGPDVLTHPRADTKKGPWLLARAPKEE